MKKRINNTLYNLHNHLDEIAVQDVLKGFKAPSKVENSGFQLLPSTSAFTLYLSQINSLLASVGIVRRLPHRVSSLPHTNKGMNRYATFTIRRLNHYKEVNPEVYWRVVESLIQNSVTFRTMAFHKTHKNGYKELPLSFVKNIVRKVNKIIDELQTEVDFKRTYIPKSEIDVKKITEYLEKGIKDIKEMKDVTFRPLGIPTHAGRIVLSMHANFIALFMEKRLSENQHAYLVGRGTGTAGESILNKIHEYKYIYEIDLKQCFPNIQAEGVTRELAKQGVPLDYCVLLEAFNRSTPRTGEEEEKRKANEDFGKKIDAYLASLTEEEFKNTNGDDTKTIINKIKNSEITTPKVRTRGMPQGANTSPILTEIVLDHWIRAMERVNNATSVFYADDGIFFSNEPIVLANDEQRGIEIHEGKSGPIKEDGVGLKEFKFCSIIYNPGRNTIRSSTRKGAELEMNTSHGIFEMIKSLKPSYSGDGGSLFRFTNLKGLIMDRLYNGRWDKPKYPEHVTLQGVNKSGMQRMGILDNFSTTSSDAVAFLANGIKGDGNLYKDPPVVSKIHAPKAEMSGEIVIKGKNKVPKGVVFGRRKR